MSRSKRKIFQPHEDFVRLVELFPAVQEYQRLASKHGISDIFQDNGGKILQLCLCLGISILPGREGNDAIDETTGGEFELKTLNFLTKGGFTTHHHLNPTIIAKYRRVDWIFAAYEGIELKAIWRLTPRQMEPWFSTWETKWHNEGGKDINNPKVSRVFVIENGELLYPRTGQPVFSEAVKLVRKRAVGSALPSRTVASAVADAALIDPPFAKVRRRMARKR